jgi:hypothetical protein
MTVEDIDVVMLLLSLVVIPRRMPSVEFVDGIFIVFMIDSFDVIMCKIDNFFLFCILFIFMIMNFGLLNFVSFFLL